MAEQIPTLIQRELLQVLTPAIFHLSFPKRLLETVTEVECVAHPCRLMGIYPLLFVLRPGMLAFLGFTRHLPGLGYDIVYLLRVHRGYFL